jgi:hypothetical protein
MAIKKQVTKDKPGKGCLQQQQTHSTESFRPNHAKT